MDTQSIIAIALAVLAGIWAAWLLLKTFIASLRPVKNEGCGGGCGCGHDTAHVNRRDAEAQSNNENITARERS